MPFTTPTSVREGEILDGKYRVDRVIGAGGMGVVVAATHIQLQTRVALKFLLPDVLDSPQVVDRFLREARAAARIQSEHVGRVLDVGTLADDAPYIVMEYLQGRDLAELLADHQTLPIETCVGYILEACEAIAEAHSLGIVHRDLKPANLFLARRAGREAIVKVLDFGISKTMDRVSAGLTKTSAVMGSPCYMSPEQMRSSKDVDARADIWALGVILYELVTGALPFPGETLPEVVCRVTQGDMRPIQDLRPDVPEGLSAIIGRCLSRDPDHRYPNVAWLARSLAPFAPAQAGLSLDRICRILEVGEGVAPPATVSEETGEVQRDPSLINAAVSDVARSALLSGQGRRRRLFVVLGATVTAIAAVVAWQAGKGRAPIGAHALSSAAATAPSPTLVTDGPDASVLGKPALSSGDLPSSPAEVPVAPDAASVGGDVARARPANLPSPAGRSSPPARRREPPPPPPPVNRGLNMGLKE